MLITAIAEYYRYDWRFKNRIFFQVINSSKQFRDFPEAKANSNAVCHQLACRPESNYNFRKTIYQHMRDGMSDQGIH